VESTGPSISEVFAFQGRSALSDTSVVADEVVVTAVVAQQWRPCFPGARCELEIVFMANNLSLVNSRKASVQVPASVNRRAGEPIQHRSIYFPGAHIHSRRRVGVS